MNERLNGVDLSSIQKAKDAIRYNAEQDLTWKHHEIAQQLYGWTDRFRDRLIDPIARVDRQGKLPGPVLGFERTDHRVLAYYHLGHNAHGLEDEIVLNDLYLDRPLYSILETVLHEQLHLWQQRFGEHPVKDNYHNREFIAKARALGLHPLPVFGCHTRPADGAFEALLREYGIPKPTEEFVIVVEGERKNYWDREKKEGKSTLVKWECGCGQIARVGKKNFFAHCDLCGDEFKPVNGKAAQVHPQVKVFVYEAPKEGK